MTPSQRHDIALLAEKIRDGEILADEHARLEEILMSDAEARRLYLESQLLHANLQTLFTKDANTARPVRPAAVWKRMIAGMAAAGLAAASVAVFFWAAPPWPAASVNPATPSGNSVARVIGSVDAHWLGGSRSKTGDELAAQRLHLARGLAELRFACGASVVLEGPAEITLDTASQMTLHAGRLAVAVPNEAVGFVVRTRDAEVVDLGTEFGVHSGPLAATAVHVFKGEVALGPARRNREAAAPKELLTEGKARRITTGVGGTEEIAVDELAFVTPREFEARLKSMDDQPYYRWLAAHYSFRRDPSLMLYYTFDDQSSTGGVIGNAAGATAEKFAATMGDGVDPTTRPQRLPSGRWPAQRALGFDPALRQHLQVPHAKELNVTQAVTVFAWIRPHMPLLDGEAVIVTKSPQSPGPRYPNYELGLTRAWDDDGHGFCRLFFQAGERRLSSADFRTAPGEWTLVAAATNADRTVLYVNGRAVAEGIGGELPPNDENILVGAAFHGGDGIAAVFAGAICEVAIMRRFATEEEIHAIYSVGSAAGR
jgi:ferric-dicitrate binding protein FerR (iron transport regulator)